MVMASPEQLYTIQEAAKIMKVSEQTIRRMIARKELDTRRVGIRGIRITKESLEKFTK